MTDPAGPGRGEGAGLRELLIVFAALIALTAVTLHAQVVDFYRVPDLGDPLLSMWRMAWVPHQLAADPRHLFDANIFYPAPAALTYSDSMILPGLTAAPLLWAGVHPAVAYNLLFLSGFVLSGLAMYVLTRALGYGPAAAWVAAIIFGFYPYRLEHYSHLELQMAQWMPVALLAIHRVLATGRRRYALVLALAIAAQWYSSMYYGLFLMFYLAAFGAVLTVLWRPGWRPVGSMVLGVALGMALTVPLARAYSASAPSRGVRDVSSIEQFSARPSDYLKPTRFSALYGSGGIGLSGREAERALFPGIAPVLLAAVGAAPPLTATRVAALAAGIVAFDGSLGFNGHWYPFAHKALTPFKSVRVPARFAILVGLTLALLSAAGVDRWWHRATSRPVRVGLLALMTAALMAEAWPSLDLRPVWRSPPALYDTLAPDAVLFEYPLRPDPEEFATNIPYMYFSTWHWTRMVNGYSGFSPPSYAELARSTAGFPGGGTVDYLNAIGVTHITVHCALWEARACGSTLEQLDRDSRLRLSVGTQWDGAPSRLYELVR